MSARGAQPQECHFDNSLVGMQPELRRFPREWLRTNTDYLAWSATQENYVAGGEFQYTRGNAFYPWLPISFRPDELYLYSEPKYSEFIQATIATPVYMVGIEIGFSNGGGSVVAIKVKGPSGWMPMYTGAVDLAGAADQRKNSEWARVQPLAGVLIHGPAS